MNRKSKSDNLKWWQAPYPITVHIRNRLIYSICVGIFIGLFLLVFRPFGINSMGADLPWYAIGFGIVSFLMMVIWHVGVRAWWLRHHDEEEWTVLHEITLLSLLIGSIGLANYPLAQQPWIYGWSWAGVGLSFAWTIAIGIFPTSLSILIHERAKTSKYNKEASAMNDGLHPTRSSQRHLIDTVTFTSLIGSDTLILPIDEFRCIKAADNYINVFHMQEGVLKSTLLRNTMKYATEQCGSYKDILRIHKSFIANLSCVEKVKGNAQGYRLVISDVSEELPVSRSLNNEIRARFVNG